MPALGPGDRRYFAAISLFCGAVLMAGGWGFWMAGTGQFLVPLGLAAIALALVLDHSTRTVLGSLLAFALGMIWFWLPALLYGLSQLD